eukprot:SAG22_NODE_513_length_9567_cov_25.867771_4_plen_140_part_00
MLPLSFYIRPCLSLSSGSDEVQADAVGANQQQQQHTQHTQQRQQHTQQQRQQAQRIAGHMSPQNTTAVAAGEPEEAEAGGHWLPGGHQASVAEGIPAGSGDGHARGAAATPSASATGRIRIIFELLRYHSPENGRMVEL